MLQDSEDPSPSINVKSSASGSFKVMIAQANSNTRLPVLIPFEGANMGVSDDVSPRNHINQQSINVPS